MKPVQTPIEDPPNTLPRMPTWVTEARDETPEDLAFLSGAALSALHFVLMRIALRTAET